jgi:hypothetical protein
VEIADVVARHCESAPIVDTNMSLIDLARIHRLRPARPA